MRVKTDISGYGPVTEFATRDLMPHLRLWGVTPYGGKNGLGTLFSFSIDSASFLKHYDKDYHFDGQGGEDDERFWGSLIPGPEGIFYGHVEYACGDDIFTVNKEGKIGWWESGGYFYDANMMLASNNNIYATNNDEMIGGVIDRYDVESRRFYDRMHEFEERRYGRDAGARLLELSDGYLYGTANKGGINEGGLLYRVKHDGSAYEVIHYFEDVLSGVNRYSGLIEHDGFLYGTTAAGGVIDNAGTIFKIMPDGSSFSKIHDFSSRSGQQPYGEVVVTDNVLYGMTKRGGDMDHGVIYRINTGGSGFAQLHSFSGTDGSKPSGALVLDNEGNLYGMTSEGGASNMGVIFTISPDGTRFSKLFDFTNGSGGNPNGSLVIREDVFAPPVLAAFATREEVAVQVTIHPNPSTDNFKIEVNSKDSNPVEVTITDLYGQEITTYEMMSGSSIAIGEELEKGIYLIKVMQGQKSTMRRIVKK